MELDARTRKGQGRSSDTCIHCGRRGHWARECPIRAWESQDVPADKGWGKAKGQGGKSKAAGKGDIGKSKQPHQIGAVGDADAWEETGADEEWAPAAPWPADTWELPYAEPVPAD